MSAELLVLVAAHEEGDRIEATVRALRDAFPGAVLWVADDASRDETGAIAESAGARVLSRDARQGKGGNVNAAAEAALARGGRPGLVLLCDADLGASAGRLGDLVKAVDAGRCDLAIATFSRRVGGGFGVALGFARWAIERRCGFRATAPISGQRAMRGEVLEAVLPFAAGYGMEIGITVDAIRAGYRVEEIEVDLEHRSTGRTVAGFVHRARQLRDFTRVWWQKRK
jgi:glycosyltransferase involved in cell wall biosynthesis